MNAGELRHRVIIQQLTTTTGAIGGITETWSDVATVWAAVEDLTGREYFSAQQVNAEVTTRVRIRYRVGIVPAMRVVTGSRTLDIKAVLDPDGRRRELHLMCAEVV